MLFMVAIFLLSVASIDPTLRSTMIDVGFTITNPFRILGTELGFRLGLIQCPERYQLQDKTQVLHDFDQWTRMPEEIIKGNCAGKTGFIKNDQ